MGNPAGEELEESEGVGEANVEGNEEGDLDVQGFNDMQTSY